MTRDDGQDGREGGSFKRRGGGLRLIIGDEWAAEVAASSFFVSVKAWKGGAEGRGLLKWLRRLPAATSDIIPLEVWLGRWRTE